LWQNALCHDVTTKSTPEASKRPYGRLPGRLRNQNHSAKCGLDACTTGSRRLSELKPAGGTASRDTFFSAVYVTESHKISHHVSRQRSPSVAFHSPSPSRR